MLGQCLAHYKLLVNVIIFFLLSSSAAAAAAFVYGASKGKSWDSNPGLLSLLISLLHEIAEFCLVYQMLLCAFGGPMETLLSMPSFL